MSIWLKVPLILLALLSPVIPVVLMSDYFTGEGGPEDLGVSWEETPILRWEVMRGLDLKTSVASGDLVEVLKGPIKVPGYIVPLEVGDKQVSEFLLVPTQGACVHVPPPPANQMLFVRLKKGGVPAQEKRAPVWVQGRAQLSNSETKWGEVSFLLDGVDVRPYEGGY